MADVVESRSEETPERRDAFTVAKLKEELLRRGKCSNTTSPKDDTGSDLPQYAVLVPIIIKDGIPYAILTVRSAKLSRHPGQVSFPGGKHDPGDADLVATALREAHEEIGLAPENVTVLASMLPFALDLHTISVTPVVAIVQNFDVTRAKLNPLEVEFVFLVPLEGFMKKENVRYKQGEYKGMPLILDYFSVAQSEEYTIWGFTAIVLTLVASVYFGRLPDFEYRKSILGDNYNIGVIRAYIGENYSSSKL